jgi:hypothetical protein
LLPRTLALYGRLWLSGADAPVPGL